MPTLSEAAVDYAEAGFRVFPIWPTRPDGTCCCPKAAECDAPGKHPHSRLVPQGLKNASEDPEQVRAWWRQAPTAFVGLCTGGPFFVLDVDRHGGIDGRAALQQLQERLGIVFDAPVAETGGGGEHWFFGKDEEIPVRNQQKLRVADGERLAGLDVRGDGGYVVAAPSGHASGGFYRWLRGSLDSITAAPPALLALVTSAPPPPAAPEPASPSAPAAVAAPAVPGGQVAPAAVPVRDSSTPAPAAPRAPKQHQLTDQEEAWIAEALAVVPPNIGRDDWIHHVSMPLHDGYQGSSDGFEVWHAWCARGVGLRTPNGNAAYGGRAECEKVWRSFSRRHKNPKGLATFWGFARQCGWTPSPASTGEPVPMGQSAPAAAPAPPAAKAGVQLGAPPLGPLAPAAAPGEHELKPWPDQPEDLWKAPGEPTLDIGRAFPAELSWLGGLVDKIGELHSVPPAFPAMLALGIAAGCVGRVFDVKVSRSGWVEPMSLWVMAAMPSGAGKSPVIKSLRKPIDVFQFNEQADLDQRLSSWEARRKVAHAKISILEREVSKAVTKEPGAMHDLTARLTTAQQEARQIDNERPQSRSLLAASMTTPAMVEFLMQHQERALVLDSEGDIFQHVFGRTAGESHVGPWLQAFSGDTIKQRRVGDRKLGPVERFVRAPALSMALVTQTDSMDVFRDKHAISKGFVQRFITAVFDGCVPSSAIVLDDLPADLAGRWHALITKMLELQIPKEPIRILLDGDAFELMRDEFERWLDTARRDPREDRESVLGYLSTTGPKLRSQVIRMIGLMHVMVDPHTAGDRPVLPETVTAVIEGWLPFIRDQIARTNAVLRDDPDILIAERVLRWLFRQPGRDSFTRTEARDAMRAKNSGFGQVQVADDLNHALQHLSEAGWIQPAEKPSYRYQSVPAAARYVLHPRFHDLG